MKEASHRAADSHIATTTPALAARQVAATPRTASAHTIRAFLGGRTFDSEIAVAEAVCTIISNELLAGDIGNFLRIEICARASVSVITRLIGPEHAETLTGLAALA